jgi:hypothetical protein
MNENEYLLEKLAEQFTAEELEEILGEAQHESAAEKTASDYYELGQIMAVGFQDELEKQAGVREAIGKALKWEGPITRRLRKTQSQGGGFWTRPRKMMGLGGYADKPEGVLEKLKGLSGKQKAALGLGAGALAGGAAVAASRGGEKKSYDRGVYDALDALGLLD